MSQSKTPASDPRLYHPPVPGGSIRRRAYAGAGWTLGGEIASNALRLVGNVLLARMLMPEAFGLMALMGIMRRGLEMFTDIGVGPNIVQNTRGEDPEFLGTAWTIHILRSIVLALLLALAAFPMAWVYEEPRLLYLLPVFSIGVFIHGLASPKLFLLQRRMLFRTAAYFDLGRHAVTVTVMLMVAWFWPSVWALVVGSLVGATFHAGVSFFLIRDKQSRLAWDRSAVRDLLIFGGWIFLATALTFMATSLDRLLLGRFLGVELFGVFAIAYLVYEAPRGGMIKIAHRVLLPAVAAHNKLPRDQVREKLGRNRPMILIPAAATIAFGVCVADLFIVTLYDARYAAAAWMLPVLLLGLWPRLLTATLSPSLIALGQPKWGSLANAVKLVSVAVVLPAAFFTFGTPGAVIAIACLELPQYVSIVAAATREGIGTVWQDMRLSLWFIVFLGILLGARWVLGLDVPFAGLSGYIGLME